MTTSAVAMRERLLIVKRNMLAVGDALLQDAKQCVRARPVQIATHDSKVRFAFSVLCEMLN